MELRLEGMVYFVPEEWISGWNLLLDYKEDTGSTVMELDNSLFSSDQLVKWLQLNARMDSSLNITQDGQNLLVSEMYEVLQFFHAVDGRHLRYCRIDVVRPSIRESLYKELGLWIRRSKNAVYNEGFSAHLQEDPYYVLRSRNGIVTEALMKAMELSLAIPLEILYGIYHNGDLTLPDAQSDWKSINWTDLKEMAPRMHREWVTAATALIQYCLSSENEFLTSEAFGRTLRHIPSVLPTNTVNVMTMTDAKFDIPIYLSLNKDSTESTVDHYYSNLTNRSREARGYYLLGTKNVLTEDVRWRKSLSYSYGSKVGIDVMYVSVRDVVEFFDHLCRYIEAIDNWSLLNAMTGISNEFSPHPPYPYLPSNYIVVQAVGVIIVTMSTDIRKKSLSVEDRLKELVPLIASHMGRRCLVSISTAVLNCIDKDTILISESYKANAIFFCETAMDMIEDDSLPMGLTKWYSESTPFRI